MKAGAKFCSHLNNKLVLTSSQHTSGRMAGHLRHLQIIMSYRGGLFKHERRTESPNLREKRQEFLRRLLTKIVIVNTYSLLFLR